MCKNKKCVGSVEEVSRNAVVGAKRRMHDSMRAVRAHAEAAEAHGARAGGGK